MNKPSIAIIGTGLIGGSLALALRRSGFASYISGCAASPADIEAALMRDMLDRGTTDPAQAAATADIIVICTPLGAYEQILRSISRTARSGAIITDVGSVKGHVARMMGQIMPANVHIIPAHPIAGTEKSGPYAGFTDLFDGKHCVVTPHNIRATDEHACDMVYDMWLACGSDILTLDTDRHDAVYAAVSHNVQLAAYAYSNALYTQPSALIRNVTAKAAQSEIYRKFIRLSGSNPIMWRDIFLMNRDAMSRVFTRFEAHMRRYADALAASDKDALLRMIGNAHDKRLALRIKEGDDMRGVRFISQEDGGVQAVWTLAVPVVISACLVEVIEESEYEYASGAGLHGITSNLLFDDAASAVAQCDMNAASDALTCICDTARHIIHAAQEGDEATLHRTLADATILYNRCY